MGNFTIKIGQYIFWIPPEAYTNDNRFKRTCTVYIVGWDNNYYVIGKQFLFNYFITLNYADNTVEFRSRPGIKDDNIQELIYLPWYEIWIYSAVGFVISSILIAIYVYCFFFTKDKRTARKAENMVRMRKLEQKRWRDERRRDYEEEQRL